MSISIVEKYSQLKQGTISVKPYFDGSMSNMGLEKYGLSLHDGTYQEEQLACIELNGVKRYKTGLNEFAPEVKLIEDVQLREAKAREIRMMVSQLEKDLNSNVVDVEDKEFWNKIKLLRPDNDEFWSKISLRCGNEPVFLDPIKDPYDLIKLMAIEAGGFSLVARNYEDARSMAVPPKFFLDKYQETVSTTTEYKKLKNNAIAELQKLAEKNPIKLLYVAKVLDTNSVQYKKNTPQDIVYDNMDKFILGEGSEKNKKRSAHAFIDTAKLDMEVLKLRSIIKDATFYKFIAVKSDGFIYHTESSTMLGRNSTDVLAFLQNPLNDQILGILLKLVEKQWSV